MKRWVVCWGQLVAALLLMGGVGALQAEARDPLKYFFQESFGDLSEEMAMAREEGRSPASSSCFPNSLIGCSPTSG